jgi:RNA polymerase sigma-70 factor (ECF subfamily)
MVQGQDAAYREFYDRYFDRLLRYLLVITGGREEAAREALQSTFLRVVRHIKRFDSEAAFWGWLAVLARSAAIDEKRKQIRYLGLLARLFHREKVEAAVIQPDPESHLMAALTTNLGALSPDERELVARKYFGKESVADIAGALGLSEKAIESRLVRIRRKLKKLILADLRQ